jgi:hypothetical protein
LFGQVIGGRDIKRDREVEFRTREVDPDELQARIDKAGKDADVLL